MPETTTPAGAVKPVAPTLDLPLQYEYDGKTYGPGEAIAIDDPIVFVQLRRAAYADNLRAELHQAAIDATAQEATEKAASEQAVSESDGDSESVPVPEPTKAPAAAAAPVIVSTPPTDEATSAGGGTPDTDKSENSGSDNAKDQA